MRHADPYDDYDDDDEVEAPPAPDAWADLDDECLTILRRLAQMGMNLAGALEQEVLAKVAAASDPDTDAAVAQKPLVLAPRGDPAMVFARIARCVRMTVALMGEVNKQRLASTPEPALHPEMVGAADRVRQRIIKTFVRPLKVSRVEMAVRDMIAEQVREPVEAEALRESFRERLYEDPDWRELDRMSVSGAIAFVCEQFGLTPDWERWRREDWAIDEAGANSEGSPYARRPNPPGARAQAGANGPASHGPP